jgi:hypothetical protein
MKTPDQEILKDKSIGDVYRRRRVLEKMNWIGRGISFCARGSYGPSTALGVERALSEVEGSLHKFERSREFDINFGSA